jgi:hypothetical protein
MPSRRSGRSRAAAARRRRSRRRLVSWGGTAIVVAVLVLGGWYLLGGPSHAPKSKYITTLRKGEVRLVPDACGVIPAKSLSQYLDGTPSSAQPYNSAGQTQCTYTVDAKPTFRQLNISVQAFRPNLTLPGNGSATAVATYTFSQQRKLLAKPPKPQPPATISSLPGLGDEALTAVQVFRTGSTSDLVTVVARYRNVIVSVVLQGRASGGFGPVTVSGLRVSALAVARTVMDAVKSEPTVG